MHQLQTTKETDEFWEISCTACDRCLRMGKGTEDAPGKLKLIRAGDQEEPHGSWSSSPGAVVNAVTADKLTLH
jgi:hypothetical protein